MSKTPQPADARRTLIVTEQEAADLLRLAPRTLQALRLNGSGPKFCRLTSRRIGYAVDDLNAWVASRTVASTSTRATRAKVGAA